MDKQQQIEGRHAVAEALRAGHPLDRLFVLDGCKDGPVTSIVKKAKRGDTVIRFVSRERLDQLSETGNHQGVIAYMGAYAYATVEEILQKAGEKEEAPFLFLLDGIEASLWVTYAAAAFIGAASDACQLPFGISVREAFGSREYSKKLGVIAAFDFIALALGPSVMTMFYDALGNYDLAMILFLFLGIAGAGAIHLGTKRAKE